MASSTRTASTARARTRANAGNARRRSLQVPWWRSGKTPIFGTVAIVVLLIAVFVYISNSQAPNIGAQPADATVVNTVTHVSPAVFSAVGTGGVSNQLKPITGAVRAQQRQHLARPDAQRHPVDGHKAAKPTAQVLSLDHALSSSLSYSRVSA